MPGRIRDENGEFRRALAHARELRENLTLPERMLWNALRSRSIDGLKFRRQHVIGRFVVDFVCVAARLVVEVDGESHDVAWKRDRGRDAWLRAQGWRVVRVANNDVITNREGVVTMVARAAQRPPLAREPEEGGSPKRSAGERGEGE